MWLGFKHSEWRLGEELQDRAEAPKKFSLPRVPFPLTNLSFLVATLASLSDENKIFFSTKWGKKKAFITAHAAQESYSGLKIPVKCFTKEPYTAVAQFFNCAYVFCRDTA